MFYPAVRPEIFLFPVVTDLLHCVPKTSHFVIFYIFAKY